MTSLIVTSQPPAPPPPPPLPRVSLFSAVFLYNARSDRLKARCNKATMLWDSLVVAYNFDILGLYVYVALKGEVIERKNGWCGGGSGA